MEKAMIICLAEPVLNPLWVYLGKGFSIKNKKDKKISTHN